MPLANQLALLETSGLIRLAQDEVDMEYLFRHGLIQDAAYESLLRADRKALHLIIGEALESAYPKQLTELAPTLAQHFARAEAKPRARYYFTLAANAALANFANAEAERHYRAALDLASAEAEQAALLAGLGEALFRQSKFEQADEVWRKAINTYQRLSDFGGVARMYARAARTAGMAYANDATRALAVCREGLAVLEGQSTSPALAALLHETARACFYTGALAEARALCQQALSLAERFDDLETQAETLATLWGLLPVLAPKAALEGLQRGARLAEAAGRLDIAARTHRNLGFRLGLELGELAQGREHVRQAVKLLQRIGDEAGQFYSLDVVIVLSFLLGDLAAVEKTISAMRVLLPNVSDREFGEVGLRGWEAWLLRCRGEWEAAQALFQTVRVGLREHQAFDTLANMDCTFAEMSLELNDLALAEDMLGEALELVARGLMEPVEPGSLQVAVLARHGQLEKARQDLAETREQAGPQPGVFSAFALELAEARLSMAEGQPASAWTAFEKAVVMSAQHHLRWHHAQTLREWAEAHLARNESGDIARARELLREAQSEFEAMNVPKYAALVGDRIQSL